MALYNVLIEFGVPAKIVRLIKMCLPETCNTVHVDKSLSDMFPIRNGLKQGDGLLPLFLNFTLDYAIMRVQVNQNSLKLNDQNTGRS
jgi:sorting nexin-29